MLLQAPLTNVVLETNKIFLTLFVKPIKLVMNDGNALLSH